ncbi:MAG: thioredoxin family protein [Ignavibacteria bacterium]|nr:thioredoxin family protein [Ignavibacteria bacterium]
METTKEENKAVLVNFTGSDWCKWCFKLSGEVFSQDEFKEYAYENLILVKVDFPHSTPNQIKQKLTINCLHKSLEFRDFQQLY